MKKNSVEDLLIEIEELKETVRKRDINNLFTKVFEYRKGQSIKICPEKVRFERQLIVYNTAYLFDNAHILISFVDGETPTSGSIAFTTKTNDPENTLYESVTHLTQDDCINFLSRFNEEGLTLDNSSNFFKVMIHAQQKYSLRNLLGPIRDDEDSKSEDPEIL